MRRCIFLAAYLISAFVPSWLQASCGSAACTLDTRSEERNVPHQLITDISFQYINQDQPRIGNHPAVVGQLPNPHHDEIATINRQATARLDYDLSERWGISVSLPFVGRTHDHISKEEATTARNTGGDLAEVTLQPGTGSYDVTGGVSFWSPVASVPMLRGGRGQLRIFGSAKYRINTAGTKGYRMGNEVLVSPGAAYPVLSNLDLLAQIDGRSKAKDHRGETDEDTNFTGGDFLWVSPGMRVHLTPQLSMYGYLQLPIYRRVNNEQITADRQALVGLTYAFVVGGER